MCRVHALQLPLAPESREPDGQASPASCAATGASEQCTLSMSLRMLSREKAGDIRFELIRGTPSDRS